MVAKKNLLKEYRMYDVIIVGAGSAGLAAGIYAARGGMSALILEKVFAGGQIARAHIVENYPGFPDGVSGVDLALNFRAQAERHGAIIKTEDVTGYDLEGEEKKIVTVDNIYKAKTVVLAMGAKYRTLGLNSEKKYVGSGVSYCATCDGAFFKNKEVAVIGGGDTALEDALYLAGFASRIYVIHRRDELRGQKALQKAAMQHGSIEFIWDTEVDSVLGGALVEAVRIKNKKTQKMRDLSVSGVFIAIGTMPETEEVKDLIKMDNGGYIITDAGMRTNLPGVFAAGDIVSKSLRQVITAAADGAIAIYSAQSYLHENE
ncbi:MAG: thioredoxin-disulfide reductase [Christensenellales bacterium]